VLPVFAGITAGAFVGAISAQGNVNQLAVAATGGFAVWLITLVVIGVPDRCKVINISHFRTIENTKKEGPLGNQLPTTLDVKDGPYDVNGSDFVLFIGAVISNIYTGPNNEIDLDVEVDGLDKDNKIVWKEPDHYDSLVAWHDVGIARKFTPHRVEMALGENDVLSQGKFILVWAIECFDPKELYQWSGAVKIKVTDHHTRSQEILRYLSLDPKSPQLASNSQCSLCVPKSSSP
jgi:hypothetical protein